MVKDLPLQTILKQKFALNNSTAIEVGATNVLAAETGENQTHDRRLQYGTLEKTNRASRLGSKPISSVIADAFSPEAKKRELKAYRKTQLEAVNKLGSYMVEMAKVLSGKRKSRKRRHNKRVKKVRADSHRTVPKRQMFSDTDTDSSSSDSSSSVSSSSSNESNDGSL